jgi:hypothetical protein
VAGPGLDPAPAQAPVSGRPGDVTRQDGSERSGRPHGRSGGRRSPLRCPRHGVGGPTAGPGSKPGTCLNAPQPAQEGLVSSPPGSRELSWGRTRPAADTGSTFLHTAAIHGQPGRLAQARLLRDDGALMISLHPDVTGAQPQGRRTSIREHHLTTTKHPKAASIPGGYRTSVLSRPSQCVTVIVVTAATSRNNEVAN